VLVYYYTKRRLCPRSPAPEIYLKNDLKNEYFLKIITGAWGIDKFDEFVQKWHVNGGDQILGAINAWYATFK
jgi:putative aldouronate transport system substrate-binding protein